MNLNQDYTKLDPSGVEFALKSFTDQILVTFDQVATSNIPKLEFDSIIISGMGGSSNAGKIIQSLLEPNYSKVVVVYNDYDLPAWVNNRSLVIVNSYSGNTEESLSAIKKAKELGCEIVGIATGGQIGQMITAGDIYGSIIDPKDTNPTGFPKTGLGISIGALLGVVARLEVFKITRQDLELTLNEIKSIRQSWDAKSMAEKLHGYIPMLFSSRPLLGGLNAGRNAMCEISRNFTEFYDFPEVNHVLVEAMQKPDAALKKYALFFESQLSNQRVLLRYEITKDILKDQGINFESYKLKSQTLLGQLLELAHYCAWVGFYISILDDCDPGPEPWIIKLKSALSQPTH